MRRISEAQLVVILQMQEGWRLRRVYDSVSLETNNCTWNIHRNIFNALFDKGLIELKYKVDDSRRTFCLTKRAADLPLGAWKNYYLAKAADR
jgi:predicted GNAT superfamily acetyltransferase